MHAASAASRGYSPPSHSKTTLRGDDGDLGLSHSIPVHLSLNRKLDARRTSLLPPEQQIDVLGVLVRVASSRLSSFFSRQETMSFRERKFSHCPSRFESPRRGLTAGCVDEDGGSRAALSSSNRLYYHLYTRFVTGAARVDDDLQREKREELDVGSLRVATDRRELTSCSSTKSCTSFSPSIDPKTAWTPISSRTGTSSGSETRAVS